MNRRKKMFFKKIFNLKEKKLDFLIIGAQKSGTTSLHEYLDKHQDIFMSKPLKEPGFFMPIKFMRTYFKSQKKPIDIINSKILMKTFMMKSYNGESLFGESSTYYTLANRAEEFDIPARIHKYNPKMKLIYVLRDPFERLYSNYRHDKKKGRCDNISFGDYLNIHRNDLFKTSLYFYQIEQYLHFFKKENILLLTFNEVIKKTNKTLKKIFTFLDIDDAQYSYQVEYEIYNKGSESKEDYRLYFKDNMNFKEVIEADLEKLYKKFSIDVLKENHE